MSQGTHRDGNKDRRGTMTRGQFLATGASAAAAASLGVMPLAASGALRARAVKASCASCTPEADKWEIPAATLNALWADCFPRLVAEWWADTGGDPYPNNPALVGLYSGGFYGGSGAAVDPDALGKQVAALPTSSDRPNLQARQTMVSDYLQSDQTTLVPIRILPSKGFDFVLSDWGLDLFAPPRPDLLELYRYYSFRRTGRPTIGLPFYMADGTSAIDINSPTGPSQAWVDPDLVLELLLDGATAGNFACITNAMKCATEFLEDVPRADQDLWESARRRKLALYEQRDRNRLWFEHLQEVTSSGEIGPDEEAIEQIAGAVEDSPGAALSVDSVKCVLEAVRCWQISGSVYRGIQGELPRVVATAWMEQVVGSQGNNNSYYKRLGMDGTLSGPGLREILAERLESGIPAPPRMEIGFQDTADDLVIKSQGLFFPKIQGYKAAANVAAAATDADAQVLKSALASIVAGDAGNPVFTDSMRTN